MVTWGKSSEDVVNNYVFMGYVLHKHCTNKVICLGNLSDSSILLLSVMMASYTGTDNSNTLQMQMRNLVSTLDLLSALLRLKK